MELGDDRLVEVALLLRGGDVEEDELDEDDVLGPVDAEVVGVGNEVLGLVFVDDLEAVLGDAEVDAHLLVDDVGDGALVFGGLSLEKVDSCERHGVSFSGEDPGRDPAFDVSRGGY